MLKKLTFLKKLIATNNLTSESKLNTIIKTLQKTNDIVRARVLSEEIIQGDFSNLKEATIENLIESFSKISTKEDCSNQAMSDDISEDNKVLNLETLQFKYNKSSKRINELEERNRELVSKLSLTNNSDLLKISYETYNY